MLPATIHLRILQLIKAISVCHTFYPFTPEFFKWIIYSLNLDTFLVANTCLVKNQYYNDKQCRSRWDGLLRAVSSGSALFAKIYVLNCRDETVMRTWTAQIRQQIWTFVWSGTLLFAYVIKVMFSYDCTAKKYSICLLSIPCLSYIFKHHISKRYWTSPFTTSRWVKNNADQDKTPRYAASDLGRHCLLRPVCSNI